MVTVVVRCTQKCRDTLRTPLGSSYRGLWRIWPVIHWYNQIRIILSQLKDATSLQSQFTFSSLSTGSSNSTVNDYLLCELMQIHILENNLDLLSAYSEIICWNCWHFLSPFPREQPIWVKNMLASNRSVNAACFFFYISTTTAAYSTRAHRKKGFFLNCPLLSPNITTQQTMQNKTNCLQRSLFNGMFGTKDAQKKKVVDLKLPQFGSAIPSNELAKGQRNMARSTLRWPCIFQDFSAAYRELWGSPVDTFMFFQYIIRILQVHSNCSREASFCQH